MTWTLYRILSFGDNAIFAKKTLNCVHVSIHYSLFWGFFARLFLQEAHPTT